MNPLGSSRAIVPSANRPCLLRHLAAGGQRQQALRGALLGASGGAAAAGLSALAARGLSPLAAGGVSPRRLVSSSSSSRDAGEFGHPNRRMTDILLVTNVVLFGLQLATQQTLTVWGAKVNALIVAGQWWRLLTPAFLHGSITHLIINSFSLNNLGPTVEATAGPQRYLLMYLAAAVAGNTASFYGSAAPSLGASGAIFGLGGALAAYFYRNRELYGQRSDRVLKNLWNTLLINVVYGLTNPRIDNWGHLGGLVGGALAAMLLGPKWEVRQLPGKRGRWLVDSSPVPWLRSEARPIGGGGGSPRLSGR